MNYRDKIEQLADAVLYEGYALFPYRKNSLKNRKRFNFGVLSPKVWAEKQTNEHFFQQTEVLFSAAENARINFKFRYLRLEENEDWQTARETKFENSLIPAGKKEFQISDSEARIGGRIEAKIENLENNLFKLTFNVENLTALEKPEDLSREKILSFSFVSAHTIFEIENGEFFSVIEPTDGLLQYSQTLENINCFPVLAGDKTKRNGIFSAPLILYDFPEAAENSFDNFFDGLEIDELMMMNILALTEREKEAMKNTDDKTRRILEKIESASTEDFLKLHAKMKHG